MGLDTFFCDFRIIFFKFGENIAFEMLEFILEGLDVGI
jgi:hypothetical protein